MVLILQIYPLKGFSQLILGRELLYKVMLPWRSASPECRDFWLIHIVKLEFNPIDWLKITYNL